LENHYSYLENWKTEKLLAVSAFYFEKLENDWWVMPFSFILTNLKNWKTKWKGPWQNWLA